MGGRRLARWVRGGNRAETLRFDPPDGTHEVPLGPPGGLPGQWSAARRRARLPGGLLVSGRTLGLRLVIVGVTGTLTGLTTAMVLMVYVLTTAVQEALAGVAASVESVHLA